VTAGEIRARSVSKRKLAAKRRRAHSQPPAVEPKARHCAIGFRFNSAYTTPDVTVSDLEVTLIGTSPRRWLVKSLAPHVAVCVRDESYFELPFELELVEVTG
jgi:hypothetical protein